MTEPESLQTPPVIRPSLPSGPEAARSALEAPRRKPGRRPLTLAGADDLPCASPLPDTPWGFWATLGWTALIALAYLFIQGGVVVVYGIWVVFAGAGEFPEPEDFETNGLVLAVATVLSAPVVVGLCVLFAWMRRQISLREYLGFHWPTARRGARWGVAVLALVVAVDLVTTRLGRPIVPEVMVEAYRRAQWLPLFWVALVLAAPVSEELLFRGFLFAGLERSRLQGTGTVLVTSVLWALIHVQYDAYGIAIIFIAGILIGYARLQTGSVLLCIALHGLMNLIATSQVAFLLSSPGT